MKKNNDNGYPLNSGINRSRHSCYHKSRSLGILVYTRKFQGKTKAEAIDVLSDEEIAKKKELERQLEANFSDMEQSKFDRIRRELSELEMKIENKQKK